MNPSAPDVAKVFNAYPQEHRKILMELCQLIFDVADSILGVGSLEETLKWGEPSYLTSESKTGTTIRIDWKPKKPNCYVMYFNYRTDLVEKFRTRFPDDFDFDGDRTILFEANKPIPMESLSQCIESALTYHRDKTLS